MLQKDNFVKIGKIKKKVGKGNEYVMTLSTNLDIFSVLENFVIGTISFGAATCFLSFRNCTPNNHQET